MMTRLSAFSVALLLSAASGMAVAADNSATLDTKAPCDKPQYPRASLVNEEAGIVTAGFLIGVDGNVVESRIEKSSGFRNLDKATTIALSKCKFKPGTKDGKPDQSWARVDYVWKLE